MAALFSTATLEQVRAASDIVDIIGASLPLKRAGANFVALCPFHKEKTPSFNVNPQKQIFYCFGCHKGGDAFTFVREYENLSFTEAVRRLAERAKIPLAMEHRPGEEQNRSLKETLLQIHEQITLRWQNALTNDAAGQIARDYLAKRGVPEEAVKFFRLGYAPDLWDDTVNWAKSKGHDLPLVEKAGLILRKEGADHYYDRFRGRLIFPICDEQGRVIAFSGRVLSGDEKTAKYVNSPETPLFTKGRVIYGLDKSKRALLDSGQAVICEGQLDLIACFQAGIKNIVAPQGTALTAEHARILKRHVDEVVLCFDSDTAGQNAAIRAFDDLLASGLAIRVATVPAPHDPDSFIKQAGGPALQALLDRAEGFFDFYLNRLCSLNDAATDRGRQAVVSAMAEAVRKAGNAVLADACAQKTAQRLGVSPEAVRTEFKKISAPARHTPAAGESGPSAQTRASARPAALEFWLLKLLFQTDENLDGVSAHFDPNWLQHTAVRQLVNRRLTAHSERSWRDVAALMSELEEDAAKNLLAEAMCDARTIPNRDQQLNDLVLRLRNQFIDQQLARLTQQTGAPGLADTEKIRLLNEQQRLRKWKQSPLAPTPA